MQRHRNAPEKLHGSVFGLEALISSEQTPQVMGMFSGCYLVLCGNEIVGHLIATLRLWRPPLDHYWNKDHCAARGLQPTGCLEVKRLPESAASRMIDRRLEEVSLLTTLAPRGGNFLSRRSIQTGCRGFEEDALLNQINGGRKKKSREIDEAEIGKKTNKHSLKENKNGHPR